ncbi:MAG: hypothetical protein R2719_05405 [Micropruina sp.]
MPATKGRRPQPGLKGAWPRVPADHLRTRNYTEPASLDRLRNCNLNRKRSLALRGLSGWAVDRLVAGEPLWRVHEAVFGVLALESNRSIRGCESVSGEGLRLVPMGGVASDSGGWGCV